AASSSVTSRVPGPPGASASHESHRPHGSAVGPCTQLSDRARMRADEVLPQPRGPEKRYAWLMRPEDNATESGSVTCSWPTTSAKEAGRYVRERATAQRVPTRYDDEGFTCPGRNGRRGRIRCGPSRRPARGRTGPLRPLQRQLRTGPCRRRLLAAPQLHSGSGSLMVRTGSDTTRP